MKLKPKKKLLLVLIWLFLPLMAIIFHLGCRGGEPAEAIKSYRMFTANHMPGKPKFERPSNWPPEIDEVGPGTFFIGPKPSKTSGVNLSIMFHKYAGIDRAAPSALFKAVNLRIEDVQSIYRASNLTYIRPQKLGGIEGLEYSFIYHYVDREQNTDVWGQTVATIIISNNEFLELRYSGEGELFPMYYEAYERAIKSFEFTD